MKHGTLATLVILGLMWAGFQLWVNLAFAGRMQNVVLAGSAFGVMHLEAEAFAMQPVDPIGWDGQFYFYLANDLDLSRPELATTLDTPAYRSQRIGLPLLSRVTACLFLSPLVHPWMYHFTQFLLVSIATVCLGLWQIRHGRPAWYALGWTLSLGVINSLAFGMPDPAADALFILSAICLLQRNLVGYGLLMALTVLTREGFALFAFVVFCHTCLRPETFMQPRWKTLLLTALPGVILILWWLYVAYSFKSLPASGSGGSLLGLPFAGWWKMFSLHWQQGVWREVLAKLQILGVMGISLVLIARASHERDYRWASISYGLLMFCLGPIVYESADFYFKSAAVLVAMALLCQNLQRHPLVALALALFIVQGVAGFLAFRGNKTYLPWQTVGGSFSHSPGPQVPMEGGLKPQDLRMQLTTRTNLVFQDMAILPLSVENLSQSTWPAQPSKGPSSIQIHCQFTGSERVFPVAITPLSKDIGPGETARVEANLLLPEAGEYELQCGLVQLFSGRLRGANSEAVQTTMTDLRFSKNGGHKDLNIEVKLL